jgi:hypothetical protein
MTGFLRLSLAAAALLLGMTACTPRYDWREVHGADAPYTVLMPVKPASHARPINLGGVQVTMTMTAADVDGALFAVGTAVMPDAAAAANALATMKTALVRNIGGTIRSEKAAVANGIATLDVEAAGEGAHGRLLFAHLVAKETRIYQVIAIGTDKTLPREAVDTFLTSFKLN